ncbi:helix-turn-helix domain-containing protein [Companilactobacillus futsaii]|uniref:Helix-turn-helix transcriptional regulator n=2 Tax=Companilactobacillus futsaii TaxID=938155 RepID=A0A5B7T5T0_9LACO|nr:helix-turn-helix transcriptional regulator [Companilactobacillus futsaii]KRK95076.1 hypothetical protein FC88_GL002469 [Companilactobacillus futsaii JCM 17355]QCX25752.1 helix-turn-helix transcriptional regulator [Companilactobacillus futsaii]
MIANKLNVLLAERQLSIKEVVEDTGLSRNSISNISNNVSANISTDTIDILCNYLGVAPKDFFEYSPLRINVEPLFDNNEARIVVKTKQKRKEFSYFYDITFKDSDFDNENEVRNKKHDLYLDVYTEYLEDEFLQIFNKLPVGFQNDITKKFIVAIENILNSEYIKNIYAEKLLEENKKMKFKEMKLQELLKSIKKDKITLSIKFNWIDVTKILIIQNDKYIIK